jgi:DNA-binding winged helix-turn-helix (wHTH) protein/Tol biopolymer transport system component
MDSPVPAGTDSVESLAVPEHAEYLFGPFRMDVASLQLWKGDQIVPLTPKAFDTLHVLVRHHTRLVRKEELLGAVWPNSFVSEDSLAQNITALRRSLGDDHNQPQYIATVPRRGYRFIAAVTKRSTVEAETAAVAAAAPAPATAAPDAAEQTARAIDSPRPGRRPARLAVPVAAVLILMTASAYLLGRGTNSARTTGVSPLSFTLDAPSGTRLASGGMLSPDGRSIAFVAQDESNGVLRVWVRALDTGIARSIEGTEGAARPFWSPDSASIGFFANGWLKRIGINGGSPPQSLASFVGLTSSGGSWNTGDKILFASYKTGLWAVPAAGGQPSEVTVLDAAKFETAHRWPQYLPDNRHFLFSVASEKPGESGVFVGSLDSKDRVKLLSENAAVYAPPGYLLFMRGRVLLAQPFDVGSLTLSGKPVPVSDDVAPPTTNNNAVVSAASDLLTFGSTSALRMVWFDRAGTPLEELKSPIGLSNPSLSNNQSRLVAGNGTDIWLEELDRGAPTRVVPGTTPMQSPDGAHIAYTNARQSGVADIFVRSTSGPGQDELLVKSDENKFVSDWSRDGRFLVYGSLNRQTKMDLWVVSLQGEHKPTPFMETPFNEFQAQISPDGRWIAYASDESGIWETYVQSFPVAGAKRAISVGGGSEPQWRADGRELFYLGADGKLMSVDVQGVGGELQASRRRALFQTPIPISGEMYSRRNHYVVSSDGQRFLMNAPMNPQGSISMLVNWRTKIGLDSPAE